jgi:site-specific recombinase XerD
MYYESCIQEKGLSSRTVDNSLTGIHKLLNVVLGRGVQEFSQISRGDIQAFVETLSPLRRKTVYGYLSYARCFLRYLYQQGFTSVDLSVQLPTLRRPCDNDRIPSAYSPQELRILLGLVDRANPKGKRLYAMMLLSSLYGLRGGEVCGLRFNDIDWDRNTIHVIHEKGGKDSLYPLLPAVGNAIIDYIRNARPDFDSPCIFLSAGRPVKETTTASFSDAVSELIRISEIPVPRGKRTGCHTLRHSCATMMLENDVSLPVISEVLAHSSTETTSIYTAVDATHLRQCALEVEKILQEARQ